MTYIPGTTAHSGYSTHPSNGVSDGEESPGHTPYDSDRFVQSRSSQLLSTKRDRYRSETETNTQPFPHANSGRPRGQNARSADIEDVPLVECHRPLGPNVNSQRPAIVAEDSGVRLAGGPPGEALSEYDAQSVLPPPYRIY